MKKLLLLAFICLMGFYACKKDADGSKKIIGKWIRTKSVQLKNINGVDSLIETENGFGANDYTQFNKDGTGHSTFGIPDVSDANFTYQVAKDTLFIRVIGGNNAPFKIKTFTSSNLTLRIQVATTQTPGIAYYKEDYYTK